VSITTPGSSTGSSLGQLKAPPALACFLHIHVTGQIEYAEGQVAELFGNEKVRGRNLADYLRTQDHDDFQLQSWLEQSHTEKLTLRTQMEGRVGQFTPIELQATYQGNGVYLIGLRSMFTEIVELFAAQQIGILEMLALGKPQDAILTRLVLLIEEVIPGAAGSVVLLDPVKKTIHTGSAPHLPAEYNQALNGLPIGPATGSCGTALYLGRRIVVKDILSDPLWADYQNLASLLRYRACWSTPFYSEDKAPLGSFAIYYQEQRGPQPYELAILDAASHLAAVVVSHHLNQTRLQTALAALKQSENQLQGIFDFVNDSIIIHDSETGKIIDVNQRAVEMYGWTKEEFKRLQIGDLSAGTPPYTQEEAVGWIRRARAEGPQILEWRAKDRSGNLFWVEVNLRHAQLGVHNRVLVTVRDISRRKFIEERLELALRGTDLGLWDWDIPTGEVILGERWLSMLGYDVTDLPHDADIWRKLLHPDDMALVDEALQNHFSRKTEQYNVEFRLRAKTGYWHWVQARGRVMEWSVKGEPLRMTGTHLDIHEHRSAEEHARENERVMETLLGNLVGMAYRCRIDEFWTMEFVSHGCLALTGYQPEEIVGNRKISYEEVTHPEDRQLVREGIYEALAQGRQFELSYRIITASGAERIVWERGIGIHSADGKLQFLEGFITDITEIQQSQDKITEQAALLDRAQDAIIVRDLRGVITYWNQGASRLYGWSKEEAIGKPVLELFYREESGYLKALQALLKHSEWSGELQHVTKENREISVESRWTLLRDEKGNPRSILTINTDITEKKRLEAQFLRAQRMESIGTLAGGIAHDLNNVLAPIIMSIDLLRLSARSKEDHELLNQMDISANRGADLVRQVLSFARGMGGRRVSINPSYLIKEIIKIVKETFPKSITIRSHRSADLWMVSGDPTQLHQVLLNLCVNARDAMPYGGTLSLLAENTEVDAVTAATMENARAGQFVRFIVEDTGTGIPEDLLGRIFEPFFTTKEIGKGTGLGLSTVLAIVRSHGGFIQVESILDKGTSFHIYLPTTNLHPDSDEPAASPRHMHGNGEHILIVDDEASVRSVLKSTLTTYGYQVWQAENGAEALAVYERERGQIKAVITDMMMPVMDGPALIANLRRMDASLPIIASSGLNESINLGRSTAAGVNHFLAKPYSAETVLQALREALRQRPII
jgi:PAS domain S-box-containing protein